MKVRSRRLIYGLFGLLVLLFLLVAGILWYSQTSRISHLHERLFLTRWAEIPFDEREGIHLYFPTSGYLDDGYIKAKSSHGLTLTFLYHKGGFTPLYLYTSENVFSYKVYDRESLDAGMLEEHFPGLRANLKANPLPHFIRARF